MTDDGRPVVIVGTGGFARVHAAAVRRHPGLTLRGVVGRTAEAAADLADTLGVIAFRDLGHALSDPEVEGVVLATPNSTHVALASVVLEAGLSVLVEKPIGVSAREVDQLADQEARSAGRVMSGHLMRWAPAHRRAKVVLDEGLIGDLVMAESRRMFPWHADRRSPWHLSTDEGGGMWLVQGVHVIDQLCWLLGRLPDRAIGTASTLFHEQSADDTGVALLGFGDITASATVLGTRVPARNEAFTDVHGTEGTLRVSHRGELSVDTGRGWTDLPAPTEGDPWAETLQAELSEFVRVLDGGVPETDLAYGRRIVATVDAVKRSQASGRWEAIS